MTDLIRRPRKRRNCVECTVCAAFPTCQTVIGARDNIVRSTKTGAVFCSLKCYCDTEKVSYMQSWADMGLRERLFAADKALRKGKSIAFAQEHTKYNYASDTIAWGPAVFRVDKDADESLASIRRTFPGLFPSDEVVLRAVSGRCPS